ncbi:MAG: phosphoribosylformylglycinamidine synthase subunit PurS [Chloroflexota bacterium]|nr:phosphoribosylformylglycinamidine synthase subunit PurS [Chloroflexota bacterium]
MYLARVYVTLKPTVNDPQGITVLGGLKSLGFETVTEVRVGKFLEIRLNEADRKRAESEAKEMCDRLLANPVIEQYSVELVDLTE